MPEPSEKPRRSNSRKGRKNVHDYSQRFRIDGEPVDALKAVVRDAERE